MLREVAFIARTTATRSARTHDRLTVAPDGSWGRMNLRGSFLADGAVFAVRYGGRVRFDCKKGEASLVVAPTFETGHASHDWLNFVQAIGLARLNFETREWFMNSSRCSSPSCPLRTAECASRSATEAFVDTI
jgi:hypothetical protein